MFNTLLLYLFIVPGSHAVARLDFKHTLPLLFFFLAPRIKERLLLCPNLRANDFKTLTKPPTPK